MKQWISIGMVFAGVSLCVLAESTVFSDDFSTGTETVQNKPRSIINGWSGSGPEPKEYNLNSSGVLAIQDNNGDEKGNGVNKGTFEAVWCEFEEVCLKKEGDWMELSADFNLFPGSYEGATVAPAVDRLRVGLTGKQNSGKGYGLYLFSGGRGGAAWSRFKNPNAADILKKASSFNLPEGGALVPLVIRLTCVADGIEMSGSFGGTSLDALIYEDADRRTFIDTLTFCLGKNDHALRIDNVLVKKGQ